VVVGTVERAKEQSDYSVAEVCSMLGVGRSSYYRYQSRLGFARPRPSNPKHPYTLLPEEVEQVVSGALEWPELSHRPLAYKLMREGRAFVSPSAVYHVLKGRGLHRLRPPKKKRYKRVRELPGAPDQRWQSDLKYVRVPKPDGGWRNLYLLVFQDEYSRCVVHHELLWKMDGASVSLAAQAAFDRLKDDPGWKGVSPIIQSDNGSCYISGDFDKTLSGCGLLHERITPHCPEENGKVERLMRTLGDKIEDHDLEGEAHAREVVAEVVRKYNEDHLHAALNYLAPLDYYRGDPDRLIVERKESIKSAREDRRQTNMGKRKGVLPVSEPEPGRTEHQPRTANELMG
jgi:transposase InsO family protein